ncbi:hypothetical protein [Panacagrimonas sp.]|uniref:hypothetical protein n=1 Tax=Panacagrimonas sp. TaxID=2480088 RepID=UPI003B52597A
MSDEPTKVEKVENLVLELLRYIPGRIDRVAEDVSELKARTNRVETEISLMRREMAGLHEDFAGLSGRVDRLGSRIDRIEQRLELAG